MTSGGAGAAMSVLPVPHTEPRGVHVAEGDVHGLLLGVEVDRAVPALVAETGGLHPAERGAQVADVVRVQPDHAGLDRLRDAVAAGQVAGPDVAGEPVTDVVGQRDRLGL